MGDNDIESARRQLQNGASPLPTTATQPLSPTAKRKILSRLYRAALDGNWEIANGIYEMHRNEIQYNAVLTRTNQTALHLATGAKKIHFVEQLVSKMLPEELARPNEAGDTALCLAAFSGKVELAKLMMRRRPDLAMVRGREDMLPIYMAALIGHRKMVLYFYKATKPDLEYYDKKNLFVQLIRKDIYDVALDMLKEDISLATARDDKDETALHALADKSSMPSNLTNERLGIWNRCIYAFSAANRSVERIHMHKTAIELVQCVCDEIVLLRDSEISELIKSPWRLRLVAAEKGNVEFLTILLRSYPDLAFTVNDDLERSSNFYDGYDSTYKIERHSIFHAAVLHRQEKIFKLIHEIGSIKDLIITSTDREGNNMLHLAARLPSAMSRLHVPGAALQLQRELLWFEEVKNMFQMEQQIHAKNKEGLTADVLFEKNHTKLVKDGEKWMRGTANSCMVVATLIATVVFAAGFTVPGGNVQENGIPIFIQKIAFKVFAVTNALSLIFSASSVLSFLSIMTSRYAMDDFNWSLPNKLMIGLVTLFISISAMLMAFIAAFFLVFNHGHQRQLWFAIPIAAIASLPVILFIQQHYRLFMDVIKSTYLAKSIFKPSGSLFSDRLGDDKISSKEE